MIETLLSEAIINRHLREQTPDMTCFISAARLFPLARSLAAFQNVCLSLRLMSDPFKIAGFGSALLTGVDVHTAYEII